MNVISRGRGTVIAGLALAGLLARAAPSLGAGALTLSGYLFDPSCPTQPMQTVVTGLETAAGEWLFLAASVGDDPDCDFFAGGSPFGGPWDPGFGGCTKNIGTDQAVGDFYLCLETRIGSEPMVVYEANVCPEANSICSQRGRLSGVLATD